MERTRWKQSSYKTMIAWNFMRATLSFNIFGLPAKGQKTNNQRGDVSNLFPSSSMALKKCGPPKSSTGITRGSC